MASRKWPQNMKYNKITYVTQTLAFAVSPLWPPSFFTRHLRTSSALMIDVVRFQLAFRAAGWLNLLQTKWALGEGSVIHVWAANTWPCSLTLPLCGFFSWALSELKWWIIHNFNSCCCWNVPRAVKGELGLYWPSFYTTDKHIKPCHMHRVKDKHVEDWARTHAHHCYKIMSVLDGK